MIFTLIFLVCSFCGNENGTRVIEDLKSKWLVLEDGKFKKFNGHTSPIIHAQIDLRKYQHQRLRLDADKDFFLFLNADLVGKSKHFCLDIDSLLKVFPRPVLVSAYQNQKIGNFSMQIISINQVTRFENSVRPDRAVYNFILLAVFMLIIYLTALFRTNPQLTLDYFNIVKLFSMKRRDESWFTLRVTSSVNLHFYFFCSLLTALALLVTVHFSEGNKLFESQFTSVSRYFLLWIILSFTVAIILIVKYALSIIFSNLFEWKETAGFQFFSFVRLLISSLMILGSVCIISFLIGIDLSYSYLPLVFCCILVFEPIIIFLKLLGRLTSNAFHLFSYLCVTEILPLIILIKILLF